MAIETPDGWSDWSPVAPRRVRAKQEEMIGFMKKMGRRLTASQEIGFEGITAFMSSLLHLFYLKMLLQFRNAIHCVQVFQG